MSQHLRKASKTAKHASVDDPSVVRSLVTSTPLHEAPATAVIEEPAEANGFNGAAVSNLRGGASNNSTTWNTHLAQLLHSMYLVTFTEKAQLGAMYSRNGKATAQQQQQQQQTSSLPSALLSPPPPPPIIRPASSAAGGISHSGDGASSASATARSSAAAATSAAQVDSSASPPVVCSHSITVDARWLDAVTRYCHFTATIDDVARVAMVFPTLLEVRWTMEQPHHRAAPRGEEMPEHTASFASTTWEAVSESVAATGRGSASNTPVAGGKLTARVYLCQDRVISIEEAAQQLAESLRRRGSATAQRAWKALVNHHTAYVAYVDTLQPINASGESELAPIGTPTPASRDKDILAAGKGTEESVLEASGEAQTRAARHVLDDHTVSDDVLCTALSADLRASLSEAKLQALLRQMRRDAAHVEEAEQHRIAQRQLQERMLNAYEHVRALYGPKDTRGRSAMALITSMQQESRFEDTLDIKALLSALLAMPASGLSATMLREERVVAEAVQPAEPKGVTTRSKRRRENEGENPKQAPPVVVRVMEPTLVPITDLRPLTDEELELVLVRLDRTRGSVKGVWEATTHKAV